MSDGLHDYATRAAQRRGLPPDVVLGIITVESGWRTAAHRVEPPYRYLWDYANNRPFRALTAAESASETPPPDFTAPAGVSKATEWQGQQASWGLMQVMGAVAREHGFKGDFFTELCTEPTDAIEVGCQRLAACVRRWGAIQKAIAAYNAGSPRIDSDGRFENQAYVDKVLAAAGSWSAAL